MPKIVDQSEFGEWCNNHSLTRSEIENLTGYSQTYVSLLSTGKKELSPYFQIFFYDWWQNVFDDKTKEEILFSAHKHNPERT